jgi:hypothetical protein
VIYLPVLQEGIAPVKSSKKKRAKGGKRGKREPKVYRYEFPRNGAKWYSKKTGTVVARSVAEAKKVLVKRGLLHPTESEVTEFTVVTS